jgi:hypothetical protein
MDAPDQRRWKILRRRVFGILAVGFIVRRRILPEQWKRTAPQRVSGKDLNYSRLLGQIDRSLQVGCAVRCCPPLAVVPQFSLHRDSCRWGQSLIPVWSVWSGARDNPPAIASSLELSMVGAKASCALLTFRLLMYCGN